MSIQTAEPTSSYSSDHTHTCSNHTHLHSDHTHLTLPDVNREVDKLGVLLHQTPQCVWLQKLHGLLLQNEAHSGSPQ